MRANITELSYDNSAERALCVFACAAVGMLIGRSIGIAELGSAMNGALPLAIVCGLMGDEAWKRFRGHPT